MTLPLSLFEIAALIYFLVVWKGYSFYAKRRAKAGEKQSLSKTLKSHREAWVERLLTRELRVADASLMSNQERVVSFFSSTTLLLLAAVMTALSNSEVITELASHIPYAEAQTIGQIEAKLIVLTFVLVYAFFKISWSLRQYGFASVVIGGAPNHNEAISEEQRQAFIKNLAKLMDSAGHDNNSGLRSYYFSLAIVFWLFNTWLFIAATTMTVAVLYHRECRSGVVKSIERSLIEPQNP